MTRVDIPTLQCNRCKKTTSDLKEMGTFTTLTHYLDSRKEEWDLCSICYRSFINFLSPGPVEEETEES